MNENENVNENVIDIKVHIMGWPAKIDKLREIKIWDFSWVARYVYFYVNDILIHILILIHINIFELEPPLYTLLREVLILITFNCWKRTSRVLTLLRYNFSVVIYHIVFYVSS